MPQQRSNKSQTPINSDAFNLTPDLATMSDSLEVVVPVASEAEGDDVAAARGAAGWPVTDARPLFVYNTTTKTARVKDSTGWRNLSDGLDRAYCHMGLVNGFTAPAGLAKIQFSATQLNRGGFTFNDSTDDITVPRTGWYRLTAQCYTTGNGSGMQIFVIYINTNQTGLSSRSVKNAGEDQVSSISGLYPAVAGDTFSLWSQLSTDVSTWGTSGYNGTFLEIEWVMP